jgi:hypothetical protein
VKRVLIVLAAVAAGSAATPIADTTPVGPLPPGPLASIDVQRGQLVAMALPRSSGRVWRIARPVDAKVLRQVSEADVGSSVVVVFRAYGAGSTTVSFALTKSDVSRRALKSQRFRVRVH